MGSQRSGVQDVAGTRDADRAAAVGPGLDKVGGFTEHGTGALTAHSRKAQHGGVLRKCMDEPHSPYVSDGVVVQDQYAQGMTLGRTHEIGNFERSYVTEAVIAHVERLKGPLSATALRLHSLQHRAELLECVTTQVERLQRSRGKGAVEIGQTAAAQVVLLETEELEASGAPEEKLVYPLVAQGVARQAELHE